MMIRVPILVICMMQFSRGFESANFILFGIVTDLEKIEGEDFKLDETLPKSTDYWSHNEEIGEKKRRMDQIILTKETVISPASPLPVNFPPAHDSVSSATVPARSKPLPCYNKRIWNFIVREGDANTDSHEVCFNFNNKLKGNGGCIFINKIEGGIRFTVQYKGKVVENIKITDTESIPFSILPNIPDFERFFVTLNVEIRTKSRFKGCILLHFAGLPRDGVEASCFDIKPPQKKCSCRS